MTLPPVPQSVLQSVKLHPVIHPVHLLCPQYVTFAVQSLAVSLNALKNPAQVITVEIAILYVRSLNVSLVARQLSLNAR